MLDRAKESHYLCGGGRIDILEDILLVKRFLCGRIKDSGSHGDVGMNLVVMQIFTIGHTEIVSKEYALLLGLSYYPVACKGRGAVKGIGDIRFRTAAREIQ